MAAPHVAGVIALLMEAFPERTGTEIKLALLATAMDLGVPGDDNDTGMGLINAGRAYEFLLETTALFEQPAAATVTSATLSQNVPNPFNPSTSIAFELESASKVTLQIYDVQGRVVARLLVDDRLGAGSHTARWDGRTSGGEIARSGLYVFKLIAVPEGGDADDPVTQRCKAILVR
jgi:subtilisin family serine protease